MMTEDEARGKLCPYTAEHVPGKAEVSVMSCAASRCMAWRWEHIDTGDSLHTFKLERTDKGYCGAFGKPEVTT